MVHNHFSGVKVIAPFPLFSVGDLGIPNVLTVPQLDVASFTFYFPGSIPISIDITYSTSINIFHHIPADTLFFQNAFIKPKSTSSKDMNPHTRHYPFNMMGGVISA